MELVIIIVVLASAGFCAGVAKAKGRSAFGWFVLGFLFPLISLLALIAVPARRPEDGGAIKLSREPGSGLY
jgi:hypothetical protein